LHKSKNDNKRELAVLINKSDFILEVVDAREPLSYRSKELEHNVLSHKDKRLIIVINKSDLVSKENADSWAKLFRRDCPTILVSTKDDIEFGNSCKELVGLIKSMTAQMNFEKTKKIHVGIAGYPNTGKSSIVNKFISNPESKIIKGSSFPGQKEILYENIRIFDNVGSIFSKNEAGPLLPKTCKNMDEIKNPMDVLKSLLTTVDHDILLEQYEIAEYDTLNEFLDNIAKKQKFLIKKGYSDIERAAKYILKEIVEGKIKYETTLD